MMQQDINKAYQYACDVRPQLYRVCRPLFSSTPVRAFTYYQQHFSGHYLVLSSGARWLEQSYSEHSWLQQAWLQKDLCQASIRGYHCRIWEANDQCAPITYLLNLYRSTHDDIKHMWSFASYLDDIDLSLYFAKQSETFKLFASRFMHLCHQYLYPDEICYAYHKQHNHTSTVKHSLLANLIQQTPLKYFPIMHQGREIWITHMEAICLQGMSDGKTAKMIGRDVGLSYRTIEKHVENLKKKLMVRSRDEMIYLFKHSRDSWL